MHKAHADVREFHSKFCPEQIADRPSIPSKDILNLRLRLMREELGETAIAMATEDLPGIADGLADLIYVAIGTAIAYGIPLPEVWDEVHRSNLSKIGGTRRADGKWQKPANFTPPDIAGILERQGPIGGAAR